MFNWLRRNLLVVAKVPDQPEPPAGAPGSVRIFRAAGNYYKLRLVSWGFAQVGAIVGICFSLWFINNLTTEISSFRSNISTAAAISPEDKPDSGSTEKSATKTKENRRDRGNLARKLARWPEWTMNLIKWAEYAAIVIFILQIPVTLAAVRLDYEQHWYIVTDRSLRIRTGLFSLQESTMSFANLQQVEVKQGPLQRLLRIADVHVQSAGGGGDAGPKGKTTDSMHHATFHGVDNSHELRDLILARLKKFRDSGLNDPDEAGSPHSAESSSDATLTAARDLLSEVRALRSSLNA
jgi:hypothetical protein|uniref:PH domain-containing protein n=1 Tax=Cephaloticoccus sp. TaxID=1985742 RepID=UPI00404A8115